MKSIYLIPSLLIFSTLFQNCVPARKFEEVAEKQEICAKELKTLKTLKTELETENVELTSNNDQLFEANKRLKKDTTLLGKSLRMKEKQYDKIDLLNQRIQEQLEILQKGQTQEKQRLLADLEKRKLELLKMEDELRSLELDLNAKKIDLDPIPMNLNAKKIDLENMSIELQKREKRVNELEEIIANKDAIVKALKDKVAKALLGFKDKGLTVEQKDGKVYVSMDAKLLFALAALRLMRRGLKH